MVDVQDSLAHDTDTLASAVALACLPHPGTSAGGKKDSWLIDYTATKNTLDVAREKGTKHFVLLSAICVQKPLLEFQKAKLKLESDLQVRGRRGLGSEPLGSGTRFYAYVFPFIWSVHGKLRRACRG